MEGTHQIGPLTMIRARLDEFNGAFMRIARWLLQHGCDQETASTFTTGSLSRELGISRPSVVHFCQELGFRGFSDFKAAWIKDVAKQYVTEPTVSDAFGEPVHKMAELSLSSIQATIDSLEPTTFDEAASLMTQADTTFWCAMPGQSMILAQFGDHRLARMGLRSRVINHFDELYTIHKKPGSKDLLVVISHSGRWREVSEAMTAFSRQGNPVIAITGQVNSLIADAADVVLLAPAREVTVNNGPIQIPTSRMLLIDMLCLEAGTRLGIPVQWAEKRVVDSAE